MDCEGYERVELALGLDEVAASQPADLLRVYACRAEGQSERIKPESSEEVATTFEEMWHICAAWLGGKEDRPVLLRALTVDLINEWIAAKQAVALGGQATETS